MEKTGSLRGLKKRERETNQAWRKEEERPQLPGKDHILVSCVITYYLPPVEEISWLIIDQCLPIAPVLEPLKTVLCLEKITKVAPLKIETLIYGAFRTKDQNNIHRADAITEAGGGECAVCDWDLQDTSAEMKSWWGWIHCGHRITLISWVWRRATRLTGQAPAQISETLASLY